MNENGVRLRSLVGKPNGSNDFAVASRASPEFPRIVFAGNSSPCIKTASALGHHYHHRLPAPTLHISSPTAVFIIIEPVDGAGAGRLLVGVLPIRLYRLRRTNMLAAHDWVNIYGTRCRAHSIYSRAAETSSSRKPAVPKVATTRILTQLRENRGEISIPIAGRMRA